MAEQPEKPIDAEQVAEMLGVKQARTVINMAKRGRFLPSAWAICGGFIAAISKPTLMNSESKGSEEKERVNG